MAAGARKDPFISFRFEVRVDSMTLGGFNGCSGLDVENDVKTYEEGGRHDYVHKFPGRTKHGNITLKRGVIDSKLWKWCQDLANGTVKYRNGSILVYDPSGSDVEMEIQFRKAFPVKWSGPELDAENGKVAMESLELAHHGLQWTS